MDRILEMTFWNNGKDQRFQKNISSSNLGPKRIPSTFAGHLVHVTCTRLIYPKTAAGHGRVAFLLVTIAKNRELPLERVRRADVYSYSSRSRHHGCAGFSSHRAGTLSNLSVAPKNSMV